jgi:hypothetical protein
MLRQQGVDWGAHYAGIGRAKLSDSQQLRHNVNNAQALKWSAVQYLFTGNTSLRRQAERDMGSMDAMFGLPTGMFNGDELIPKPPTRNPSRGIETCGVVEAMFSYTTLGAVHGSVRFFDRAERIAFNALPAAWASRLGGDMWNVRAPGMDSTPCQVNLESRVLNLGCLSCCVVMWLFLCSTRTCSQ